MSIQAMAHVMKKSKQTGASYTLMLMIANYTDTRGLNAYPSISTLARDSRMAERTLKALLPRLEASGELKIHRREGSNGTHVYEVVMPGGVLREHPILPLGGAERTPNPIGIRRRVINKEEIYISSRLVRPGIVERVCRAQIPDAKRQSGETVYATGTRGGLANPYQTEGGWQ